MTHPTWQLINQARRFPSHLSRSDSAMYGVLSIYKP